MRQSITISNNATDLLRLPCIMAVIKSADTQPYRLGYVLTADVIDTKTGQPCRRLAKIGDTLSEDHDGHWFITKF